MKLFLAKIAFMAMTVGQVVDATRAELDKLQGTWDCVSLVRDGKPVSPDRLKGRQLVIEGMKFEDRSGDRIHGKGTISIDPTGSLKSIDAAFTEGPIKGQISLGIYRLEGDTLTTAASVPKAERPSAFESKEGTGGWVVVYRRKPK